MNRMHRVPVGTEPVNHKFYYTGNSPESQAEYGFLRTVSDILTESRPFEY